MVKTTSLTFLFFLFAAPLAFGQTNLATFVALKGDLKVLKKPQSEVDSKLPQAIYEGQNYVWFAPKVGTKVAPLEVIQTGPNGQAKLVYPNGDHFIVGPGTSISLPAGKEGGTKGSSKLEMFYGKVRAMVSKNGPLNNLEIRTQSATAGVRGTDFYISESGPGGCKLTVIRGRVSVQPKPELVAGAPKESVVETGFTAHLTGDVDNQTHKIKDVHMAIKEASKEHLLEVQTASTLKESQESTRTLTPELKTEVQALNQNSLTAILNDIKSDDPRLFKQINKAKKMNLDQVNTEVVAHLFKGAPSEDPKKKPTKEEIDGLGKDVYEKYFAQPKGSETKGVKSNEP